MEINLKNIQCGEFYLNDIFPEIQRGKRLKKDDHKKGNVPYVSSTAFNNGVDGFVGNKENVRIFNNCLTIANSGSVGVTFYHPYSFVASDHVSKLENKLFNPYIYLFISILTEKLSEKYSFNREINDNRIQKEKILLPINKKGEPDYAFMEQFMRQKEQEKLENFKNYIAKRIEEVKDYNEVSPLNQKEWVAFKIKDIFEINKGIYLSENKIIKGKYPYITAKSENNGLNKFIGNETLFNGNSITVDKIKLSCFYQKTSFYCSHDVTVLSCKYLNEYNAIFICSMLNRQGFKYSYGRQAQMNVVKSETILLPINATNQVDYVYMENYIKKLEYEKLTKYLTTKK